MSEQWKDMPGHKDFYLISDLGRVISLCRDKERLLTRYPSPNGYRVTLYTTGGDFGVPHSVNRMVKLAFDPIPDADAYQVRYDDGNMYNPRLSNLTWVRIAGDAAKHRRLNEAQVREIKGIYLSSPDLTQQAIAERYGVKREAISKIINGLTWGHVK